MSSHKQLPILPGCRVQLCLIRHLTDLGVTLVCVALHYLLSTLVFLSSSLSKRLPALGILFQSEVVYKLIPQIGSSHQLFCLSIRKSYIVAGSHLPGLKTALWKRNSTWPRKVSIPRTTPFTPVVMNNCAKKSACPIHGTSPRHGQVSM